MFKKENRIIDSEWFDLKFFGVFLNDRSDAMTFLNKPQFRIGDEKITSRVLNHWQKLELLSDSREASNGWNKFSLSETIWINLILKLRNFGFSLKLIKKVKESLSIYGSNEIISKMPLLDFFISFCLVSEEPVKILVFEDGLAIIGRQKEIDLSIKKDLITDDFISIDFNKLVHIRSMDRIIETNFLDYSANIALQDLNHNSLLNEFESITIKRKGKGEFLLTKEYILKNRKDFEEIIHFVGAHNESTIIQNGNKKIYKIIEKKKINTKGRPHNGN